MTFEALKQAAQLRGYAVFSYSKAKSILMLLNAFDRARNSKGIAIIDEHGNKMIFIDDSLSEEKQTFTLAHELGHIALKHRPLDTVAEKKAQEAEADAFAFAVIGNNPFVESEE